MKSIFLKNSEAFLSRYPENSSFVDRLQFSEQASKYHLKQIGESLSLFEGENCIDSGRDLELSIEPTDVHLIIEGVGIGRVFEKLDLKKCGADLQVYIVDPDLKAFQFVLNFVDLSPWILDPRFHWMIGMSSTDVGFEFLGLLSEKKRAMKMKIRKFFAHPEWTDRFANYFAEVRKEWDATCNFVQQRKGYRASSLVGLENTLENLKWIESTPGINLLEGKFQGVPAIVVATGPSLKKSLPHLKALQDKALLLSVDASLKILLDHGITPHFVFSMERNPTGAPFFAELDENSKRNLSSHLIAYPLVPNEILKLYPGPQWVAYRDLGFYGILEGQVPRGVLSSGISVAHMALKFAEYVGCSEVALVGQDLAFDPESFSTHSEGVAYSEWGRGQTEAELVEKLAREREKLIWVPGNFHEKVPTQQIFVIFIMEFVEIARRMKAKVWNSTEGGAEIPGIEWKKLSEVSQDWKSQSLFSKIEELRTSFEPRSKFNFASIVAALEFISKEWKQCVPLLDQFLDLPDPLPPSFQQLVQVLRTREEIYLADAAVSALTVDVLGSKFYEIENDWYLSGSSDSPVRKRASILKTHFEELQSVAEEVLSFIRRDPQRKRYQLI